MLVDYKLKNYRLIRQAADNMTAQMKKLSPKNLQYNLLRQRLQQAQIVISSVENALSKMEPEDRTLLQLLFIDKNAYDMETVSSMMNMGRSSLYRRRTAALKRFNLMLNGTEQPEIAQ